MFSLPKTHVQTILAFLWVIQSLLFTYESGFCTSMFNNRALVKQINSVSHIAKRIVLIHKATA